MKKCINGYEVKVLRSAAGCYIGTQDEMGLPNCRLSLGYGSRDKLEKQLATGAFADRTGHETQFCNGGRGCQITDVEEEVC